MKKIYKKEEGVSPVIATILMVAITVVLAATVWLLVSGYMGGGGGTQITGNFASKEMIGSNEWKLTFSQFQPDTSLKSLKISISDGTHSDTITFTDDSDGTHVTATNTGITVTYYDLANNHIINSGDYLVLSGLSSGTTYTVTVLDSNGNQICSTSFTT